jgi:hypothetical protein
VDFWFCQEQDTVIKMGPVALTFKFGVRRIVSVDSVSRSIYTVRQILAISCRTARDVVRHNTKSRIDPIFVCVVPYDNHLLICRFV